MWVILTVKKRSKVIVKFRGGGGEFGGEKMLILDSDKKLKKKVFFLQNMKPCGIFELKKALKVSVNILGE